MGEKLAIGDAQRRYPLTDNRYQAGIMVHIHAEAKPVSRAQLAKAMDSSRGKVLTEVVRLIEAGLLAEEGLTESERGRPSTLIGIPRSAGLLVAVDIGATSINVALTTLGSEILAYIG